MNVTDKQKQLLLNFMKDHPDLARGRLRSSGAGSKKKLNDLWATISNSLNATGFGPQKDPQKWVKTWVGWKSNTLRKVAQHKAHIHGTGGGSPKKCALSLLEEDLLELLTPDAAGLSEIPEAGFGEHPDLCGGDNEDSPTDLEDTYSVNRNPIFPPSPITSHDMDVIVRASSLQNTPSNAQCRRITLLTPNRLPKPDYPSAYGRENIRNDINVHNIASPTVTSASRSNDSIAAADRDTNNNTDATQNSTTPTPTRNLISKRKNPPNINQVFLLENERKKSKPIDIAVELLNDNNKDKKQFQDELLTIKRAKLSVSQKMLKFQKQKAACEARNLQNLTSAINSLNEIVKGLLPQYLE